jgi:hypothetical protein
LPCAIWRIERENAQLSFNCAPYSKSIQKRGSGFDHLWEMPDDKFGLFVNNPPNRYSK